MSLFDALRGFFGLPTRHDSSRGNPGFKNPIMNGDDEEDDDDLFTDIYRHNRKDLFGFNTFAGDMLEMQRFFERQFDEIFRSFQSNWFSDSFQDQTMIPGGNDNDDTMQHSHDDNPRDRFLKPSYINPPNDSHKSVEDSDVDNKVSSTRVLDLFPDKNEGQVLPSSGKVHRSVTSQSITKKLMPHGGVEEERIITRNGQEEVQVSRQLGDKKHVVTTITLPDGTTEKREEFINMDEGQLSDFNREWITSMFSSQTQVNVNPTDDPDFPPCANLFELFRNFL